MKKRDIWLIGGLVLLGVGVYISRKQAKEQQNNVIARGDKWVFPDRFGGIGFPTFYADPTTGSTG